MEPRGAASRHWAEQACRSAGFEPDVRFETADLQAQIRLIESGQRRGADAGPGLDRPGNHRPLIGLPGNPHRTVFTSVRRSSAKRPAILAAREILAETAAVLGPASRREARRPGAWPLLRSQRAGAPRR